MTVEDYIGKIINADCMDILKQLPDKCIDLVLTDPPYKQEYHNRGMSKDRKHIQISNYGSSTDIDYTGFFDLAISKLKKINFFTFCDKETKFEFIKLAKEKKLGYREIPFCKTSPAPFINNQWLPDVEWGLHIFKDLEIMGDYTTKKGFFVLTNLQEPNINHPSPKKVNVIEKILKNISNENDLILDCFSGSGTTAVACHNLKRRFICIEKDYDYWKASCERLKNAQAQMKLDLEF